MFVKEIDSFDAHRSSETDKYVFQTVMPILGKPIPIFLSDSHKHTIILIITLYVQ